MKTKYAFLIFCLIFLLQTNVKAQDGKLDSSFGVNGYVTTSITKYNIGGTSSASTLFIQPDNKILIYGTATVSGVTSNILARYNTNGTIDSSIGNQGKAIVNYLSAYPNSYTLRLLQPDGKILFGGYITGSYKDFSVIRYNHNGSLDSSFGTNGIVIISVGQFDDVANGISLQTDGKIILAGYTYTGINKDFAIVRLTQNGAPDLSFNATGKVTTPIGSGDEIANCVAVNSVGKIIVGGYASNGSNYDFALVQYETNGLPDSTFGTNGKTTTIVGPADDWINKIVLQPDGKIIALGSTQVATSNNIILRYNTNGSVDASFGISGKITYPSNITNIALQPDGKTVIAGTNYIARYTLSGIADSSFGIGGKVIPIIDSGYTDVISSMGITSNGKIVTAGNSVFTLNTTFAVARYDSIGNADVSFGSTRIIRTQFGYTPNVCLTYGNSTAVQQDGRILMAGSFKISNQLDMYVARYNNNGTPDNSFGDQGIVSLDFSGKDDEVKSMVIQSDGKILIGGYETTGTKSNLAFVRLNSNGDMDTSFGSNGKVVYSFTSAYKDYISSIGLQGNGKIVCIVRADTGTNNIAPVSYGLLRFLTNGNIDSAFGINGTVNPTFGAAITIQNDDKIILTGGDKYAVQRFNDNGAIDTTFNNGNKFKYFDSCHLIMSYYCYNYCNSVSSNIQSDGKIVVVGSHQRCCPSNDLNGIIFRLNVNGTLDITFGSKGFSVGSYFSSTTALDKWAVSGSLQRDDKFILVGLSSSSSGNLYLGRFQKSGTKDSSFGSFGYVINRFNNSTNTYYSPVSSVIINDSCIVTAGYGNVGSGTSFAGMAKFNISVLPYANFVSNSKYGNTTTPIQFTDKSKLTPTAWSWSFAPSTVTYVNGTSDSSQHPQVRFNSNGTYSVTLASTFPTGTVSITKSNYITIGKPIVNFYSVKRTGDSTTVFNFIDSTTNAPDSWSWRFIPNNVIYQNGTSPNSQNPSLKFTVPGTYAVLLKAANVNGDDSILKTSYIIITNAKPIASFYSDSVNGTTKTIFDFTDSSTNIPTSWNWLFVPNNVSYQNGTGATSQNPSVKFTVPRQYTVMLKVGNAYGFDSLIKTNFITITNVGIEQLDIENQIQIYPNPGSGVFDVIVNNNVNEKYQLSVYDLTGKLIYERNDFSDHGTIDISFASKGIYILSLKSDNVLFKRKLIVN